MIRLLDPMRQPAPEFRPAPPRVPVWPLAGLLVAMTFLAYGPALRAGFIWDDDAYVSENAMLTAPDGWRQIWFSPHRQSQYFPLTYTTFRLERMLWGGNPPGYHLVNVLLHAGNALFLWQLLRRLGVSGGWLAAAIFALHPVQVESVAWVTELKNVQSTLFYLLALLAWVKFAAKPSAPPWKWYGLALLFHALALFSKTTACTLPAALLLVLWWRREAIGWRRLLQVCPFVLMGLAMGLVSVWWEKHLGNYELQEELGVPLGLLGKVLLATRAVWFYAAEVFWPVNLTFSYPRWAIDPREPWQYLGLVGCIAFALLLWWQRHAVGRGVVTGVVFFVAALSPLLGFIPLYTFRYSFVADHYQYLACVGLIIPLAALISNWERSESPGGVFFRYAPGGVLLVLGFLTWKQSHIYTDQESLWRDTLAKNPACWMACGNLGEVLAKQGRTDEALRQYQTAVRLNPNDAGGHKTLGIALGMKGQMDEAIRQFQTAIRLRPDYAEAHYNLGFAFEQRGRTNEAISQYQQVLRLKPDYPDACNNLGYLWTQQGQNLDQARALIEKAVQVQPQNAGFLDSLGWVLFKLNRPREALGYCLQAVETSGRPDAGIYDHLGDIYAALNEREKAAGVWRQSLAVAPNPQIQKKLDGLAGH